MPTEHQIRQRIESKDMAIKTYEQDVDTGFTSIKRQIARHQEHLDNHQRSIDRLQERLEGGPEQLAQLKEERRLLVKMLSDDKLRKAIALQEQIRKVAESMDLSEDELEALLSGDITGHDVVFKEVV